MTEVQCLYAFNVLQTPALGLVKISILFFYRRIFCGRFFNIICWTLIAIVIAWALAFFLTTVFNCGSLFSANWNTIGQLRLKCLNTFKQLLALSISDVVVDVCIFAIPVPFVSHSTDELRVESH